jgi:hypothetical protein
MKNCTCDKLDCGSDCLCECHRVEVDDFEGLEDNLTEIEQLRLALKSEHEYLRSLSVEDVEMREACISTMVRISDDIDRLDV